MITKEDIIREVDKKLVWCSQVIEDGKSLNQIQKIQNNIQYYSNKQLGELLDAIEEFNVDRSETFNKVLSVVGIIELI